MQIVEFHADQTMTITDSGTDFEGRYTFKDDGKITLDDGREKLTVPYSFKDRDTLILGTGQDDGSVDELRRITRKQ